MKSRKGDNLIVFGDKAQGLAIIREKDFLQMLKDMKAEKSEK